MRGVGEKARARGGKEWRRSAREAACEWAPWGVGEEARAWREERGVFFNCFGFISLIAVYSKLSDQEIPRRSELKEFLPVMYSYSTNPRSGNRHF